MNLAYFLLHPQFGGNVFAAVKRWGEPRADADRFPTVRTFARKQERRIGDICGWYDQHTRNVAHDLLVLKGVRAYFGVVLHVRVDRSL